MSRLADDLCAVWHGGVPFRPGGEIDWEAFADHLRPRISARLAEAEAEIGSLLAENRELREEMTRMGQRGRGAP